MAASETFYSHSWPDHSTPDPAQREQGRMFVQVMRRQPPGTWGDNRWEQVNHYKGIIYIAIRAVMSLAGGASYEVLKRKRRKRSRTTFTRNTTTKAVALPQMDGRDEEYTPLEDYDHPLAKLTRRPNPNETFGELSAKLILQNRLTGVGPLWAIPNAKRRPVELWTLKSAYMYPLYQVSRQYPNGLWRVRPQVSVGFTGGMPSGLSMMGADLPGEEVKRFMEPSPVIDWDGYSPLTAGAVHLDVLESINDSRKSAMDNGLNLDAVVIAPGMAQESLDRLSAMMTDKAGGARNHRKFVAIGTPPGGGPDGKVLLQTLGQSPRDMDYSDGYEQETRFALALFGVNDVVAGLAQGNYSERYAARRDFHDRQEQFFNDLACWYTRVLCWPWCSFEDEYVFRITLPPVNDEELIEKQLQNDKGIRSVNERRAQRDMAPVKHGEWPEDIYLKVLEQEAMPQPEPQPGMDGGEAAPEDADPLAALLGGGDTATGGAAPQPDNPDAEGTAVPVTKALADPLASEGTVDKAMSSLVGSTGGFLVPPATMGTGVKRKRRKRARAVVKAILREVEEM